MFLQTLVFPILLTTPCLFPRRAFERVPKKHMYTARVFSRKSCCAVSVPWCGVCDLSSTDYHGVLDSYPVTFCVFYRRGMVQSVPGIVFWSSVYSRRVSGEVFSPGVLSLCGLR